MIDSELVDLLSDDDKLEVSKYIKNNGYDTVIDLSSLLQKNINIDHDYTLIDADTIIIMDLHTNYKIFITDSSILTKEQVIEQYNLNKFKLDPEKLFNKQMIEVIDNDYTIFDSECETRIPQKLYNTKIYIGKERWKDFIVMFRFMRSMTFISESKLSIADSEKNKESKKNKEPEYIDKILEQVLNEEA